MARYILAWVPMAVLAILNGTLRQLTYGKVMSTLRAHQLSAVTLILIFFVYVWFLNSLWPLPSLTQAALVGLVWLLLTLAFEFGVGRFIVKQSWELLLQEYNIFAGNFWLLVPLAVAVLPALVFWIRRAA